MFHLIVTACMMSDPAVCADRLLPAADAADPAACEGAAPQVMADWGAAHHLTLTGPRCVATGALPALPLDEVAPGVLVHIGAIGIADAGNRGRIANLGVVLGPRITLIDPGGSRAEAEALYAAVRARSDAPIAQVILTHAHPDHSFGAQVFAEAGATVIASPQFGAELAPRADTWRGPYSDAIGRAEMLGSDFALPTTTEAPPGFSFYPVQPGHTGADMMVRHDASGVVFAGDVVFRGLTPVVDASVSGWLATLDGPLPPASRIVPGHGPVAADWAEATGPMRTYLAALRDAVRARIAAGTGMAEAVPAIVATLQPLAGDWADFTETTERNAATVYAELEWE